jgi:hypothetical protein
VSDTSSPLSRRTLLAGLVSAPTLTAAAAPVAAQTPPAANTAAAEQAQAALKDAKTTKLVLLGTSGASRAHPKNDFARDAEQRRRLCARLRHRRH